MKKKLNESLRNWRSSTIQNEGKIKDVIQSLNDSSSQVVLIEDKNMNFIGIITDGDLRRALLDGKTLEDSFSLLINKNPITASSDVPNENILDLMRKNDIHQIPIISENKLLGLHVIDDLISKSSIENAIVIMAGGQGMRLRPYTENCPKPMLIVGDKPMLHHIIDKAKEEGFFNFIITTHYLTEVISDYFGDGSKFNINITYTYEKEPLGTAGALALISPKPCHPFIVTNGDVMTDVKFLDILNFHNKNNGIATMATRPYQMHHPYGVVDIDGTKINSFKEKPIYHSFINAGVYVLDPLALDLLIDNELCDMPTLLERNQLEKNVITAYPMHESWIDVGRVEDLNTIRAQDNLNK
jgi:dTDP-glucose pyrophosphorylase|tara:strand:+ start:187 stop:1254 length:1068 start_codon:yes stop_codon:yes gene_type:complete